MTSKEILKELERINSKQNNGHGDIWLEMIISHIKRDLEVLEILKNRIHLKDGKLQNPVFTVNKFGFSSINADLKEEEVVFIEASGFVFKDSAEHKILKDWLKK